MNKKIIAVKKQEDNIVQVKLDDESIISIEEAIIMAKKGLIENINNGFDRRKNRQKISKNTLYEKLEMLNNLPLF